MALEDRDPSEWGGHWQVWSRPLYKCKRVREGNQKGRQKAD